MFDDRSDAAVAETHDTSIAVGIVEIDRQEGQPVLSVGDDLAQGRDLTERIGTEQYQRNAVARQHAERAPQRVAGAARRILPCPEDIGFGEVRAQGAFGPLNHANRTRAQRAGGCEHMGEQRPAREQMQDLGQGGAHPLAFTGGENGDLQRLHAARIIAFLLRSFALPGLL